MSIYFARKIKIGFFCIRSFIPAGIILNKPEYLSIFSTDKNIFIKTHLRTTKNFFFNRKSNVFIFLYEEIGMYKKVLIVDDDASFAFSLMNKAVDYDCGISLAESIGRAKVMLKNNHYDVILANSRVPGGFSYTLKNEIDSDTQILFMSSMKSDCDELNRMGVDCIRKNEICQKIEAICG